MTERENLIYTAGLLDGEGCFFRHNPKNSGRDTRTWRSGLSVEMKDEQVINWLYEHYGGWKWLHVRHIEHPNWSDLWKWTLTGKKCEELAVKLQPFLIVKREQVLKVIPGSPLYMNNKYTFVNGKRVDPEDHA